MGSVSLENVIEVQLGLSKEIIYDIEIILCLSLVVVRIINIIQVLKAPIIILVFGLNAVTYLLGKSKT